MLVVATHYRRVLIPVGIAAFLAVALADGNTFAEEPPLTINSSDWVKEYPVIAGQAYTVSTPAWSGTLQGVVVDRDDDIDLRWNDSGTERVSTVESDFNSGFHLYLSHQTPTSVSQAGNIGEFSLLRVTGDGDTEFHPGKIYSNHGELLTTRAGYGWTNLLLRGRSETTFGVRYTHIGDEFDSNTFDDLAVAENHVVTFDVSATGYWDWRAFVFSAGLSGGIGGSLIDQSGVRMDGSFAKFSERNAEFATTYVAHADALWRIANMTYLQVGARGMVVGGVAQARDTWGWADEASTARLIGVSFGLWRDF
ncbi:hypothetical protein [Aporhodopirellula aestuarii]|uniref:Uncharacterized protein n=1 Tax=Aporhodopirellula aestuarii TaxID=2950107 RepID=A0ABT0UD55_9BACT|nr:hypothetical protein [Aporhodopirellula aestuarii]MCM2374819.1 hypothetical protein [Aporhodopirellula aestuarii]